MNDKIYELIKHIVLEFAEEKEAVVFDLIEGETEKTIVIKAASGDMGRIIGKQGRIAQSLRTIAKSIPNEGNKKYFIEIKDLV